MNEGCPTQGTYLADEEYLHPEVTGDFLAIYRTYLNLSIIIRVLLRVPAARTFYPKCHSDLLMGSVLDRHVRLNPIRQDSILRLVLETDDRWKGASIPGTALSLTAAERADLVPGCFLLS